MTQKFLTAKDAMGKLVIAARKLTSGLEGLGVSLPDTIHEHINELEEAHRELSESSYALILEDAAKADKARQEMEEILQGWADALAEKAREMQAETPHKRGRR